MMMDGPAFMTAGHVEQLAKMSRLPRPSTGEQHRGVPTVKLRNVTYRPPEPTTETDKKQKHEISSDSNTDIDTPRLPTRADSNKQFFQKTFESRKENRRRRVYTKRERDRMRRQGQMYYEDSHDDVMSEIDFRNPKGYHSGYSTPGGSVDEMKLGRNMRAAPRRFETKDGIRMSQRNSSNKDLIEILNRRQQLLQQQREDRSRYLQDQEAKAKAREIVNLAYLNTDGAVARKRKEERTKEGEKLLDDAFSLAKNARNFLSSEKVGSKHSDDRDGSMSPRGFVAQQSAVDQLWSNGHIQEGKQNSVTSENNKDDDFYESPKQGTSAETEDHMVKYVRDELQRLET